MADDEGTEVEVWAKTPVDQWPYHARLAHARRVKSDLWWDEAFQKLGRNQKVIVVIATLVGATLALREHISEAAQWVADKTGGR